MPVAHIDSYYAASANPAPGHPALTGDVDADVCVVGGGIAGCATALFLAERGYKVVLLEGHRIGFGASGRSGGQAIVGYACSQDKLVAQVGEADARRMFDISVAALDLMWDLIGKHRDLLRPALGSCACRAQAAAGGRPARAPGRTEWLRLHRHSLARPGRTGCGARHRSLHRRPARRPQRTPASAELHTGTRGRCGRGGCRDLRTGNGRRHRARRYREAAHRRRPDGAGEARRTVLQRLHRREDLEAAARPHHAGRHVRHRHRAGSGRRASKR